MSKEKKSEAKPLTRVPDLSGEIDLALAQHEIDRIANQINENAKDGGGCAVCGKSAWSIYPYLLTAVTFDVSKDHHRQDRVTPFILSICENCGNTNQFLAWHYGITTKGGSKKKAVNP